MPSLYMWFKFFFFLRVLLLSSSSRFFYDREFNILTRYVPILRENDISSFHRIRTIYTFKYAQTYFSLYSCEFARLLHSLWLCFFFFFLFSFHFFCCFCHSSTPWSVFLYTAWTLSYKQNNRRQLSFKLYLFKCPHFEICWKKNCAQ